MRAIEMIVIHCTAHKDNAFSIGVSDIRRDHVMPVAQGGRGFDDVGYHYVVRRNGEIECGRMESVQGAHVVKQNKHSIGVAWVGTDSPSKQQFASLVKLTRDLMVRYKLGVHRVYGHKEADPDCGKACPGGLDMIKLREACGQ